MSLVPRRPETTFRAQEMYSSLRRTDQSGAGLVASARSGRLSKVYAARCVRALASDIRERSCRSRASGLAPLGGVTGESRVSKIRRSSSFGANISTPRAGNKTEICSKKYVMSETSNSGISSQALVLLFSPGFWGLRCINEPFPVSRPSDARIKAAICLEYVPLACSQTPSDASAGLAYAKGDQDHMPTAIARMWAV